MGSFPLKYNTNNQRVPLGYFLSPTNGDTEQPSLTINNTDILLWKNGASSLVTKNSGGATLMSGGLYYAVFDATDSNTYGPMELYCHPSGSLVIHKLFEVLNPDVYDELMSASGTFVKDQSILAINESGLATSGNLAIVDTNIDTIVSKLPTNYIMGSNDQANYNDDILSIITYVDELESRITAVRASYLDTLSGSVAQTGNSYAEVTNVTYGLSVIKNYVDQLESRITEARAGYLDNLASGALSQSQVTSACSTSISNANLATSGSLATLQADITLIQTETNKIKYILGLTKENARMYGTTYDTDGNLISCTLRTYTSASDAVANINALAEYTVTSSYSNGNCTGYTIVKV